MTASRIDETEARSAGEPTLAFWLEMADRGVRLDRTPATAESARTFRLRCPPSHRKVDWLARITHVKDEFSQPLVKLRVGQSTDPVLVHTD